MGTAARRGARAASAPRDGGELTGGMGKTHKYKQSSEGGGKRRRNNKKQNLRKKKKTKSYSKESRTAALNSTQSEDLNQSVNSICRELRKMNTSQVIVKAKLRRDEKRITKDINGLCKDLEDMFKKKTNVMEEEKECFAKVENLAPNIEELTISNENYEPGFRFTRDQQKKFTHKLKIFRRSKYQMTARAAAHQIDWDE